MPNIRTRQQRHLLRTLVVCMFACWTHGCGSGGGTYPGSPPVVTIPVANIVVDGRKADWAQIKPVVVDPLGDNMSQYAGADLVRLYICYDPSRTRMYVMLEMGDGAPNIQMASAYTTDGSGTYPNVAMGYQVFFDRNADGWYEGELFVRYDQDTRAWYNDDSMPWGVPGVRVVSNEVLELELTPDFLGTADHVYVKACANYSAMPHLRELAPDWGLSWVRLNLKP